MENVKHEYNTLLECFKTWDQAYEKWLELLGQKKYQQANVAKFEVDKADEDFNQRMEKLEKCLKNLKDERLIAEMATKLKTLTVCSTSKNMK